jgi:hypothetical protein
MRNQTNNISVHKKRFSHYWQTWKLEIYAWKEPHSKQNTQLNISKKKKE